MNKTNTLKLLISGLVKSLILILITFQLITEQAKADKKKKVKFPATKITSLNYHEGISEITPGTSFPLNISLQSESDFPENGRYQIPVTFYLFADGNIDNLNTKNIAGSSLYLGRAYVRSPRKGQNTYNLEIEVKDDLLGHNGNYKLIAWLDPENEKSAKSDSELFVSDFPVTVSDRQFNQPALSITKIDLDQQAILEDATQEKIIGGTLTVQSKFINTESVKVSACLVGSDIICTALPVWDSAIQDYSDSFRMLNLERNDNLTTLFQLKVPPLQAGNSFKIRIILEDENHIAASTYAESNFGVFTAPQSDFYAETDYAKDVRSKFSLANKRIKQLRLKGKRVNPNYRLVKTKDGSIDLAKSLDAIVSNKNFVLARALGKTTQSDSYNLPPGLVSNIPGSRFNMPDQDFPWLKDIGVKADPPPEAYKGSGFPNLTEYKRCIPFFCGPTTTKDAGKQPSESCIRRFCGSTLEDIRYGGRNPNLLEVNAGFDKSFSASGFGARVGIGGQAKVYHDKAISDYVAASYSTSAYFGVKVFSYSVPIFDVRSQTVYSPTEITDSMSRNVFKVLGRVIEKKESKSDSLSLTISQTYGVKKTAEVGIGPYDIDIDVEAGGTGGLQLAVGQIDILRGISGSLTPFARAGATAKASTSVGFGSFGVSGELTLIEDRVPVVATFNVGLNLSKKRITPQLNLNISNELIGPNGNIKLFIEIDLLLGSVTYSTTIASFSTGTFTSSIYNKDTIFAEIAY